MKYYTLFSSALFVSLFLATPAHSETAFAPECYQFPRQSLEADFEAVYQQTWCYQKRNLGKEQYLLIYNFDDLKIKKELSALLRLDSKSRLLSMSSGFLSFGKITFETLPDQSLNPYGIPLDLTEARQHPRRSRNLSQANPNEIDELFQLHLLQSTSLNEFSSLEEGTFSNRVEDEKRPFNGYWWSAAGLPLASGPHSPLGIYDQFVQARDGKNPRSTNWEAKHHSDTGVSWGGHCNGWSASSVLFKEPTQDLYDPLTNEIISPYAQKGMLAEASYCLNAAYYGSRNYGRPGNDVHDIYPDLFHKTLLFYLKPGGKVIASDYVRSPEIDNNLISGYQFQIKKLSPNQYHVNASLTFHSYDPVPGDSIGVAREYQRPYSYTLTTDAKGEISGGSWDTNSDNPDFFWVPLSITRQCGSKNPQVDPDQVVKLLQTLPVAKENTLPIHQTIQQNVLPQVQIKVEGMPANLVGDHFRIHYTLRQMSPNSPPLYLWLAGNARYPITNGEEESVVVPLALGSQTLSVDRLIGINHFVVVNRDLSTANQIDLTIESIDYVGAP